MSFQFLLNINAIIGIGFITFEIFQNGSVDFMACCRSSIIFIGTFFMGLTGLYMILNQGRLKELLTYCENISSTMDFDETRLRRIVGLLHKFAVFNPSAMGASILVLFIVTQQRRLILPVYYPEHIINNDTNYLLVWVLQMAYTQIFFMYSCFSLATYIIIVEHVAGQYRAMSSRISTILSSNRSQNHINNELNQIGSMHSRVMMALSETEKIFSVPLLCNQIFAILDLSITLTTLIYAEEDVIFVMECICQASFCMIYPFLGERITTSAKEFQAIIYQSDWLNTSPVLRRKLCMILMMSQQPVGIKSGGFHYSNYREIAQVKRLNES